MSEKSLNFEIFFAAIIDIFVLTNEKYNYACFEVYSAMLSCIFKDIERISSNIFVYTCTYIFYW